METSRLLEAMLYKSLSAAERKKADAYAGPNESFPLYKNGEHLRAAWDLAGHADNSAEIRRKVVAFAREHGLTHHLPAEALKEADAVKKAVTLLVLQKARTSDIADLLHMAWSHESMEGDKYQQANIAHWAKLHGLLQLLPASAHSLLHDEGIVHEHEGVQNNEFGQHEHSMSKAFPGVVLMKAITDGAEEVIVEGWVSTPDEDLERDVIEPEAFIPAIDRYAQVGLPLTSEHQMFPDKHELVKLPVGHGQRVAVVRDGKILKAAVHPDDAAEFEFFPNFGDGVWGRFVVTDATAASAIRKGNIRGFSWTGWPGDVQPRRPKGRLVKSVRHWAETTVAAFPVNQGGRIVAAK